MRILITGATGSIGGAIVGSLKGGGFLRTAQPRCYTDLDRSAARVCGG